jgi:hypothetical protein
MKEVKDMSINLKEDKHRREDCKWEDYCPLDYSNYNAH